ncbi:MAG: DUF4157 domain-containing protein [Polyangiales bacterium]
MPRRDTPAAALDLSMVRVHTDDAAAASAREQNARAYAFGPNLVFAAGEYSPSTARGRTLLAHECAHVVQQQSLATPALQRQAADAPAAAPRDDYLFIMGEDPRRTRNPFYRVARAHFRSHEPRARVVDHLRSLRELLAWISANVHAPIGNLFIVSHASESGTLSFGLDASDADGHLTLPELRGALQPGPEGTSLPALSTQIDLGTRIRIKGCDIGRSQEMIELIDEAFGGLGTVTAPTHEQVYGEDPVLGRPEEERRSAGRQQHLDTFAEDLPALPDAPPPLAPELRGGERRAAQRERDQALRARQRVERLRASALRTEHRRYDAETQALSRDASRYAALSGPLFERPGTTLFTERELRPRVDTLYGHLTDAQRSDMVRRLLVLDRRTTSFGQRGQRVDRLVPYTLPVPHPRTPREALQAYADELRRQRLRPAGNPTIESEERRIVTTIPVHDAAGTETSYVFTQERPTDADVLRRAARYLPDPARYAQRVDRTEARGIETIRVIAERVIAYLHHYALDRSPHEHFDAPESDARFFGTSRFLPPER